jgi:hypothetical protein
MSRSFRPGVLQALGGLQGHEDAFVGLNQPGFRADGDLSGPLHHHPVFRPVLVPLQAQALARVHHDLLQRGDQDDGHHS